MSRLVDCPICGEVLEDTVRECPCCGGATGPVPEVRMGLPPERSEEFLAAGRCWRARTRGKCALCGRELAGAVGECPNCGEPVPVPTITRGEPPVAGPPVWSMDGEIRVRIAVAALSLVGLGLYWVVLEVLRMLRP